MNEYASDRTIYASNDILSLVEYKPCDDRMLYDDWLDPDTQRGYNGVHVTTFDEFQSREIRQRFFAMIRLDSTGKIIGAVGISPPETTADLAIWIFQPYRKRGYGTSAFTLATKYAVDVLKITELHAGVYPDNIGSQKMLKKCGYVPFHAGDVREKHYIAGEDIIQMDYIYEPIIIRLAVPADAPDMAEVHMRSWEVAYKGIVPDEYIQKQNEKRPAMWQRIITDDNMTQYVIQKDSKTVGIMCVVATTQDDDKTDDVCELEGIYLHPDSYRQGIGTKAMGFAFDIAHGWNKSFMTLWVFSENVNSIKFYENLGFAPDGKTKTYDMGKVMDCIRMRKELLK